MKSGDRLVLSTLKLVKLAKITLKLVKTTLKLVKSTLKLVKITLKLVKLVKIALKLVLNHLSVLCLMPRTFSFVYLQILFFTL